MADTIEVREIIEAHTEELFELEERMDRFDIHEQRNGITPETLKIRNETIKRLERVIEILDHYNDKLEMSIE